MTPAVNRVVDLHEKLSLFSEHWSPKVVARMNDYEIKEVIGSRHSWMAASTQLTPSGTWSDARNAIEQV